MLWGCLGRQEEKRRYRWKAKKDMLSSVGPPTTITDKGAAAGREMEV
jgi:hypothetical protein